MLRLQTEREKVLLVALLIVLLMTTSLTSNPQSRRKNEWVVTYYGYGDRAEGRYTSAYWSGVKCYDIYGYPIPDRATPSSSGCAAPRYIPYCTHLLICTEYGCNTCTVVDRQRHDKIHGKQHLDVQWAVARDILPNGYDDNATVIITRGEYEYHRIGD